MDRRNIPERSGRGELPTAICMTIVLSLSAVGARAAPRVRDVSAKANLRRHTESYDVQPRDWDHDGWTDLLISHHGWTGDVFRSIASSGTFEHFDRHFTLDRRDPPAPRSPWLRMGGRRPRRPRRLHLLEGRSSGDGTQSGTNCGSKVRQGPGRTTPTGGTWRTSGGGAVVPSSSSSITTAIPTCSWATTRRDGTQHPSPNRTFVNVGGTHFAEAHVGLTSESGAECAQAVDINHDGWQDLLLCGRRSALEIYRRAPGGEFHDVAEALGVHVREPRAACDRTDQR